MPRTEPGMVIARRRRKSADPRLAALEEAQQAHDVAEAAFHKAVERRGKEARAAHDAGLDWTTIGRSLGGVGRTRAREIAHPRSEQPKRKPTKGKR